MENRLKERNEETLELAELVTFGEESLASRSPFVFEFLSGFRAGYFATDPRSPSALGLLDRWGRVGRSWFMAIAREPRPLCAMMHSYVECSADFTYKETSGCLAALWLPERAVFCDDNDDDDVIER